MDNVINTFVAQRTSQVNREKNLKHKQLEEAARLDSMIQEVMGDDLHVTDKKGDMEEGFMLLGEAREMIAGARHLFAEHDKRVEDASKYLMNEVGDVIGAYRGLNYDN